MSIKTRIRIGAEPPYKWIEYEIINNFNIYSNCNNVREDGSNFNVYMILKCPYCGYKWECNEETLPSAFNTCKRCNADMKNEKYVKENEVNKMKINGKSPSVKTYTLSHFCIGEVCMGARNGHYYLVVESENDKTQLVDLTDNKIIRDGRSISLIPVNAVLDVKSVG